MSCVLDLAIGACDFVEQVMCGGATASWYTILHHSSNLSVAISLVEKTSDEELESMRCDLSAYTTAHIVPLFNRSNERPGETNINPILIALVNFVRVLSGRCIWTPDTYSTLSQFAFSLTRSGSARLRICGIELGSELLGYKPDQVCASYHMKRFIDLWVTSYRFDDMSTRLAQLGFVSTILKNGALIPNLTMASVIKIRSLLIRLTHSENFRVADLADSVLGLFRTHFPQQMD